MGHYGIVEKSLEDNDFSLSYPDLQSLENDYAISTKKKQINRLKLVQNLVSTKRKHSSLVRLQRFFNKK